MAISIILILVMISRDNRYQQIEAINTSENNIDNNELKISENSNSDLIENALEIKEYLIENENINSPSTRPSSSKGFKIKNSIFGNDYIELDSNGDNEIIQRIDEYKFNSLNNNNNRKEKCNFLIDDI